MHFIVPWYRCYILHDLMHLIVKETLLFNRGGNMNVNINMK
jgi:hypothetical protein